MFKDSMDIFLRYFTIPDTELNLIIFSSALIILYGIIWLSPFLPPLFAKGWLWAVFAGSILITTLAVAFIQFPLQKMISLVLIRPLDKPLGTIQTFLVMGIIMSLVAALVQQGAKLVPMLIYRWKNKKPLTPRFGLILGAVAGAAFGLIEAFLRQNQIMGNGLTQLLQSDTTVVVLVVLEIFFLVAFHTGSTAIAGWGLARGKGWQFYLIVTAMQMIFNYVGILLSAKILNFAASEALLYIISLATAGWALWLRWRRSSPQNED